MADAILHIKDSYYFEVPKRLWLVEYGSKSEFPDVWIRLDKDFQRWEAERFYKHYSKNFESDREGGRLELRSFEELNEDYEHWKHDDHANAGKPFYRFLEEANAVLANGHPGGELPLHGGQAGLDGQTASRFRHGDHRSRQRRRVATGPGRGDRRAGKTRAPCRHVS